MATVNIGKKKYKVKTTDFYGSKIHTGLLHKKMGVKAGNKISASKVNKSLASLKKKKNKSKADVKKERELVFAKNAKKWRH